MNISLSMSFKVFIILCIIANTVILALDRADRSNETIEILDYINLAFYSIFALEMIIKVIGLGIKEYFKDKFNGFDFAIVIISSIDVALNRSSIFSVKGSKAIQALRAFRLLRIFKLAKTWK